MKKEAEMGVKAQQIRLEEQGLKEASEKVLAEKMKELEVKISKKKGITQESRLSWGRAYNNCKKIKKNRRRFWRLRKVI